MASRGSALTRAIKFFEDGDLREVRVAFQLVKEVVEARLLAAKSSAKSQVTAITTPRKQRRTKAQIAADNAAAASKTNTPHQTSIEEQAGTVTV